jgi:hypothetical protein
LSGWSAERLAQFDDGQPLTADQRLRVVELLRRLRSFDSASLAEGVREDLRTEEVLANPVEGRLWMQSTRSV